MSVVPVYPPFLTAPGLSHLDLTTLPLIREGGRWTLDFDRLASLITPATRLFLLCNPHNPVGTVSHPERTCLPGRDLREVQPHNLLG